MIYKWAINVKVEFWDFARAVKANVDVNLLEGNHLGFHTLADMRIRQGMEDKSDINISSIGRYPFASEHNNSGIKMKANWTQMNGIS